MNLNVVVHPHVMYLVQDVQFKAATLEIIDKVHDIVLIDRRVKVRELVEATDISHSIVISILHEQLGMKKLSARWVPVCSLWTISTTV